MAALLVIWAHIKFPLATLCPEYASRPIIATAHGAIGVDLFFIISGYVICLTACQRHHHPLDFFLARIARVAPLYLLVTMVAFAGKSVVLYPHPNWISLWNGLFYLPIFDFGDYTEPPLGAGWTLSFEIWFYTVFALLLNLWKPARVALLLPISFLAGSIAMIFYHGYWYFPRFMFHPFVLEFALGCVVFHTQNLVRGWTAYVLGCSGILSMLLFTRHTGQLGYHLDLLSRHMDLAWMRVCLWGLPWAFLAAGLVGMEKNSGFVLPRTLVWVGDISYSMYLTHRFSMGIVAFACSRLGLHNPVVAAVAVYAGCIFFACLCWRWIEKPLTSRAQKWAKRTALSRAAIIAPAKSSL